MDKVELSTTLVYASDGDANGVFYYIGTNYGAGTWVNPQTTGKLRLSGNNLLAGTFEILSDRESNDFVSGGALESGVVFDLTEGYSLVLSGYAIKSRSGANAFHLRSWDLRGRNISDADLTVLDSQTNNTTFTTPNQWLYIPTPNVTIGYRQFGIFLTGVDSSNNQYITLGEVELYGKFVKT